MQCTTRACGRISHKERRLSEKFEILCKGLKTGLQNGEMATMESVQESLDSLTKQMTSFGENMNKKHAELAQRISKLEGNVEEQTVEEDEEEVTTLEVGTFLATQKSKKRVKKNTAATSDPPEANAAEGPITIKSKNLRWEYEVLRDSVSRVKLPPLYRMHNSRAGISSKEKEQAAILGRSGKYIETGLKLMTEVKKNWSDADLVSDLLDGVLLSMTAHMRFIQEEYNGLYVGSKYGPDTKSVFKSIQRNTSNMNADDIEDLKTAVSISQPQTGISHQGRGGFRGGFRGRGFRGTGFRGRSNYSGGNGYIPRGVPSFRDNFRDNQQMAEQNDES